MDLQRYLRIARTMNPRRAAQLARGIAEHGWPNFRLVRRAITDYRAVQRTSELLGLVGLVRRMRPRRVLEIGTHHGGTLYCWAAVAADDALLLSLDLPGGEFGGGYSEVQARSFERFARKSQRLICVRKDSHDAETRAEIERILGGAKLDLLFIDGDHTYDGVKADFEAYSPLVRDGGLVAMHDIRPNPLIPRCEVDRFWREVRGAGRAYEFVEDGEHYGMGIGVLQTPLRGAGG